MYIGSIEHIARILICEIFPLGICLSALILTFTKDKLCSLDTNKIGEQWHVIAGYVFLIIFLWSVSFLIMHNYIYVQITNTLSSFINDVNVNAIKVILKALPLFIILLYIAYKLFVKITIYPDLAFRIVPAQSKKKKNKKFFQFEVQFWNSGIFSHRNMKVEFQRYERTHTGNIKNQHMPTPSIEAWHIKNVFYAQDDRACNVASCADTWEYVGTPPVFEYIEATISSEVRIFNTGRSIEFYETKKFYPLDIQQGDFKDFENVKEVPQPLITSFNNQKYVSAKRIVQKWDESLRFVECILFISFVIIFFLANVYTNQANISDALTLTHRAILSLFLITIIWRIMLLTPIKAVETPSYIYGKQE